jgi:type I restriction enzyme, S subunit
MKRVPSRPSRCRVKLNAATITDALDGYDEIPLRRLVEPERPMTYGILQCGDPANGGVPYIGPSDITGEGLSPEREALRTTTPEIASAYQRSVLTSGDVVVSIGPAYGKVAVVSDALTGANLTQDTVRVALRPDIVDTRFVVWALLSQQTYEYWDYQIMGATFRRLNLGTLARTPIPLPHLDQQRDIAAYLDRETARIDSLVEEQQHLIEMLRERRDSAWANRVETAQRLGIRISVRRVIDSIADGPFGSSLTSAHYSDHGARVIRLGNIGVNEFKDGDAAFIPLDYAGELEQHAVEQGDVVVAGLGDDKMPLGRAAVVPALGPAIVKADCYRLRPNEQVGATYLAWVMSAPQTRSQIMLLARGSTRARLNTKVVQQVEVPLPDRGTQDALVAQSVAETAKIDRLITETDKLIELARERRAALITAAVTGQIDVREMA